MGTRHFQWGDVSRCSARRRLQTFADRLTCGLLTRCHSSVNPSRSIRASTVAVLLIHVVRRHSCCFPVCRYATAISSCRPQFRLNLYTVKMTVLISSQWIKTKSLECCSLPMPMPGKRHRKIYARRGARSRIKHMLVIKLSQMHVTPLCDCTVLARSTRIRREASALHAVIRKKLRF
jgi:hypothetical protein